MNSPRRDGILTHCSIPQGKKYFVLAKKLENLSLSGNVADVSSVVQLIRFILEPCSFTLNISQDFVFKQEQQCLYGTIDFSNSNFFSV